MAYASSHRILASACGGVLVGVVSKPSAHHEAIVRLFRDRPTLAAELAAELASEAGGARHSARAAADDDPLPAFSEARVAASGPTEVRPPRFDVDLVVELRDGEAIRGAAIVEVQRAVDADKEYSWPLALASVRAELGCPATLLVVATTERVARWAATPIATGHARWALRPLVLGPRVASARAARSASGVAGMEAVALSALINAQRPGEAGWEILRRELVRLGGMDGRRTPAYIEYVLAALPAARRARLEDEMPEKMSALDREVQKLRRRWAQEGLAEARVEEKAQSVLRVLSTRGIQVPREVRERIEACRDPETLDEWLSRAVTANRAEDVVGD